MQKAAAAVAQQLNVKKEAVLAACLIADVERAFHGRKLQQNDDDDDSWDQGIASEAACLPSRLASAVGVLRPENLERQQRQGQHPVRDGSASCTPAPFLPACHPTVTDQHAQVCNRG